MLYKVVLTSKFVDETLVCDHSNESYRAVINNCTFMFSCLFLTIVQNEIQDFSLNFEPTQHSLDCKRVN